jgi:hypothetical protein
MQAVVFRIRPPKTSIAAHHSSMASGIVGLDPDGAGDKLFHVNLVGVN